MAQRKKSASEIAVSGNARKLSRAELAARESAAPMEKREELLAIFKDVSARRAKAMEDVTLRGAILTVTKFSAKGNPYTTEVPNPNLRLAQQSERQLADLAKLLQSAFPTAPVASPARKSGVALLESILGDGE